MSQSGNKNSVVMLSANFYPHVGGAERQAFSLAGKLSEQGFGVKVVTRRRAGLRSCEVLNGVEITRLFAPGGGMFSSLCFALLSFFYLLFNRSNYSVVHVHLASSHALAACLAGKFTGRPVLVKLGASGPYGELYLSRRSCLGRIKLAVLAVFKPVFLALNTEMLEELRAAGLGGCKTVFIKNGVDTLRFAPVSPEEKAKNRKELGLSAAGPVFLFTGRIVPQKSLDGMVKAMSAIRQKRGGFGGVFAIVGHGEEKENILRQAVDSGLGKEVLAFPPSDNIFNYYSAADVFVLPSSSEGLSNSMLEAMSCGLAVIAANVGAAAKLVRQGENGFIFNAGDVESLARHIEFVLDNPSSARSMGDKARETVCEGYAMDKVAREFRKIYREVSGV